MNNSVGTESKELDTVREIDKKRIIPYIQPILSDNLDMFGGEVLLRYLSSKGTIWPASEVISKIIVSGLLPEITSHLLSQVIAYIQNFTPDYHVFINTTPQLFEDRIFITNCINIAQEKKVKLVLELTEQESFLGEGRGTSIINTLSELGVKFALDDFGTGCSVLSYLKYLPIDYIKIDKLFIQDILFDARSRIIVDAIISMSKSMNIRIIAEGIESKEQFNILKKMGGEYFQGYYLDRPMPLDAINRKYFQKISQTNSNFL